MLRSTAIFNAIAVDWFQGNSRAAPYSNLNSNPNPNRINKKIQKETTLENR
jgi:hypothetical protein